MNILKAKSKNTLISQEEKTRSFRNNFQSMYSDILFIKIFNEIYLKSFGYR